jgi:hypothetical protein
MITYHSTKCTNFFGSLVILGLYNCSFVENTIKKNDRTVLLGLSFFLDVTKIHLINVFQQQKSEI